MLFKLTRVNKLNKEKMIIKLKKYIKDNFKNQSAYARHKGVSRAFVSAVVLGVQEPSKSMLDDINLMKIVDRKASYVQRD